MIESMADIILSETGVRIEGDPDTLYLLRGIGAEVEGDLVRIDGAALRALIARAPAQFEWCGTGKSVTVGNSNPVFAPCFGPPMVQPGSGLRRAGLLADYRALVEIYDESALLGTTGYLCCIAHDAALEQVHLRMAEIHLEISGKPMMGCVLSEQALIEVADLAGARAENDSCTLLHMINTTPPLVYQVNPLRCLRAAALRGQACMISSYMMSGATGPVSVIGCLAQGLAEIMIGLALTQIYRPGAPVMGGIFATPFSMQFMGPEFGSPQAYLVQIAGIQLVHRLGVPSRGDGMLTSSKTNDAQAGYEGAGTVKASIYGGADLILHSIGWLEFGRTIDFAKCHADEKFVHQTAQSMQLTSTSP